jgi:kindlin 2
MLPMSMNNSITLWDLKINISELNLVEQIIRVSGETHVGGVICQLVDKLATHTRTDWSDFALWWPAKSAWLNKTKLTLDQYGVQADAVLHFTRIHKPLRIQLPDLQMLELSIDFSQSLFYAVKSLCKELRLRHAEEISMLRVNPTAKLIERVLDLKVSSYLL